MVAIACVPEGLPMTVVSCLAIASKRMAEKDCFVKQLSSVETLGSVNLICSDKTGTLTQNKMCVENFWFDLHTHSGKQLGGVQNVKPVQRLRKAPVMETFSYIETIMGVCNRTQFQDQHKLTDAEAMDLEMFRELDPNKTTTLRAKFSIKLQDDSKREIVGGDASEQAMFKFIVERQSVDLLRWEHTEELSVPFNSKNKFSLSIATWLDKRTGVPQRRRLLMMKGAPERVLARCDTYMLHGKPEPIADEHNKFKTNFDDSYEAFGNNGERVIGFACKELDGDGPCPYNSDNWPQNGYSFLGLVTLMDPPKASVPPAIKAVRQAGIRVFMVTGDHHLTGQAIAKQVGIITPGNVTNIDLQHEIKMTTGIEPSMKEIWDNHYAEFDSAVVTGAEVENFTTNDDWDRVLAKREIVFARTSPEHKLAIVTQAQRLHNVVAVTGDGVNDSPALKKADIGIAMGRSGSDVSRDAAHVILMNDDFTAIAMGVKEGRTIFDNLTKTIAYTVTHMVPEVVAILINLAFGLPLGMNSLMILCIDLGTEMAPAVALAYENSEADVMFRPPRKCLTERLVTGKLYAYFVLQSGCIELFVCMLGYFLTFSKGGIPASSLFLSDKYFQSNSPDWVIEGRTFTAAQQLDLMAQAQTCWWVMLTGTQFFHIFMCKTRVRSVFEGANGQFSVGALFSNTTLNFAVVIEMFLIFLIVFTPGVQSFFLTAVFPGLYWLFLLISWYIGVHPPQSVAIFFQNGCCRCRVSPSSTELSQFCLNAHAAFLSVILLHTLTYRFMLLMLNEFVKKIAREDPGSWVKENLNW